MISYAERYVLHAPNLNECKARFRRLKLFMTASGLVEIYSRPKFYKWMPHDVKDHVSFWSDGLHLYILCEPYRSAQQVDPVPGLKFIVVPEPISPYCGHWLEDADSPPATASLLFAEAKHETALSRIEMRLANSAFDAPEWNLVK